MASKADEERKEAPEPGSAADLLPNPEPSKDAGQAIEEKGEPPGGGNFA